MKLEEFLKENEGKPGMAEKLTQEALAAQGVELSDDELEQAAGGRSTGWHYKACRWDEKGRTTHWTYIDTGRTFYYACPRCKRVTHLGALGYVYCDPCDTYWNTWEERRVYID